MSTRFRLGGYQGQQLLAKPSSGAHHCRMRARLGSDAARHDLRAHLRTRLAVQDARRRPAPPDVAVVGINSRTGRALKSCRVSSRLAAHGACAPNRAPGRAERRRHRLRHRFQPYQTRRRGRRFRARHRRSRPGGLVRVARRQEERVITASGRDGGWTWVEQMQPPTPVLAAAAKALGPFPLPKIDQAAFEFWAFKSSAGDAATTAAVALQVKALSVLRRVACRPQGREGARRRAASAQAPLS